MKELVPRKPEAVPRRKLTQHLLQVLQVLLVSSYDIFFLCIAVFVFREHLKLVLVMGWNDYLFSLLIHSELEGEFRLQREDSQVSLVKLLLELGLESKGVLVVEQVLALPQGIRYAFSEISPNYPSMNLPQLQVLQIPLVGSDSLTAGNFESPDLVLFPKSFPRPSFHLSKQGGFNQKCIRFIIVIF